MADGVQFGFFIYWAGSLFLLSGLAFSLFVANLRRRPAAGPQNPWDTPDDAPHDEATTR
jgi:hypothetical protein